MTHRSTRQVADDLHKHGKLLIVDRPVDPYLELAEIQRRLYVNGAPAVLFQNVVGCQFPMLANMLGSLEQARFLFRKTIDQVRRAIELKIDPSAGMKNPLRYWKAPWIGLTMLPKSVRRGSVQRHQCQIEDLPKLVSWPEDGGPFVTLPQVLSQSVGERSLMRCNLGMYRVQLSGNQYVTNQEVGLHYQLHRGIGVHHTTALKAGKNLPVNITVGGSPAMTVSAVMPLPEGLSELTFAGALAGHRIPMVVGSGHAPIYADADFCIQGEIDPTRLLPEGPFGDHLGYYAKCHDFPLLKVHKVYHREGAIWPFTVVGRPPQEDTTFGELIHELTGPIIPTVLPGVKGVHAVDAAGVHPLLLAIGSERYVPYRRSERPQELLTQAYAILGQGQMSLAKYLMIVNSHDCPGLDIHHVDDFMMHLLERVDWRIDLHFQTKTTIDTLDYSGDGFNEGSKVIIAARGEKRRTLANEIPTSFPSEVTTLRGTFGEPRLALPGVVCVKSPKFEPGRDDIERFSHVLDQKDLSGVPLIVLVDDSQFAAANLRNFLWVTFTRSNPASDIHGVGESLSHKHWGCAGSLIIDARIKPHHAAPLVENPEVTKRVDAWGASDTPISKYL